MNDPKYVTGPIVNSATGEAIPADEPVFLFRARDIHAVTVLEFYGELINDDPECDSEHHIAVLRRIEDFYNFRHTQGDRMKRPDTDLTRQGTVLEKRSEETGDVVGSIAARMMKHDDPAVRSMAASLLTQRPDRG
jgi:hypothetical protein